jgi:hypothetical protein
VTLGEVTERLDIVGVHFHCNAAHDRVQRKDYAEIVPTDFREMYPSGWTDTV